MLVSMLLSGSLSVMARTTEADYQADASTVFEIEYVFLLSLQQVQYIERNSRCYPSWVLKELSGYVRRNNQ